MKPFIVLAALVAAAQANPLQGVSDSLLQSVIRAKWSSYKAQHGKQYAGAEEPLRMKQYLQATKVIEEHNARFHAGLESFEMGHNPFSDLSREEISATKMGLRVPADLEAQKANATYHIPSGVAAPGNIDWRNRGAVQAVKDQGSCGSCYSFAASGALESAHHRKYNTLPNLSEQHAVDCAHQYGNQGCDGGWMHYVYNWAQRTGGVASQANYPYAGRVQQCRSNVAKHTGVQTWAMIRNEDQLLTAVAQVGSVSIGYNAGTQQHDYYRSGILDIPNCPKTPNHAVLIVGYGTENNIPFWILKNSWGTGWGERGYFRLRRGGNQCGVADNASYPTAV